MTHRIGVQDLKNRASKIVREVHEREAEFVVTLRGEPVAVLRPFPEDERKLRQAQREEVLEELDSLAERIARSWRSPKGAVELIEEQRR
ncbi:MAG TPA: type II toxin-antitoxin system prevent-host-death family antitoxin [Thermoanaerobaculia bacterium]|jgi:prevent-host-death family protein